jgi:molybdate transport system substrate-binding protein
MSADSSLLAKLNQSSLLYNDKYWNFTTNVLVVILPPGNPQHITSLSDLTKPGIRIAVAAWSVPVGSYTNTTLTTITKTWGNNASSLYKGPQWQNYRLNVVKNIITYETNDEQVVEKVRLGVVDAGFAYLTDAVYYGQSNSSRLQYVQVPADVNVKAHYGIAVLKNSTQTALAMKYLNFWISDDGQKLLTQFGFGNTLPSMAISTEILQFQSVSTMTVIEVPKNTEAK